MDGDRKELDAFFHFFAAFDLSRPVTTPADLSDGAALSDILAIVYAFISPASVASQLIVCPVIQDISRLQEPLRNRQTTGS